jgi:predicted ferric reductase
MSPESLFSLASALVLPGWVLLVVAPRWRRTQRIALALLLLLALVYLFLIATRMPGAQGGFGSLDQVRRLFESPHLLLAGWIHYLAFDLFIGAWEVRDARRLPLPHAFVVPCLVLTFLLGPIGLLLYAGLRASMRGSFEAAE